MAKAPVVQSSRKPVSLRQEPQLSQLFQKTHHPILSLQRMVGNQSTSQLLRLGNSWSTQNLVSHPDDAHEREAERVADTIEHPNSSSAQLHELEYSKRSLKTTASKVFQNSSAAVWENHGHSLSTADQKFFEARLKSDFKDVQIHTHAAAANMADLLQAQAFTVGRNIGFARGQYAPETKAGRRLLAHELTHVVQRSHQQRQPSGSISITGVSAGASVGAIARSVSPRYSTISDNLTYGLFDWVIRDGEAHEVLEILSSLNPTDFADTVRKMESDGLVSRLLENISETDQLAYASLIQSIQQQRSTSSITAQIEDLMSYGVLDWVITDKEAHLALESLKSLQPTPNKLRDIIVIISRKQYKRFFNNLSEADRKANAPFLEKIEAIRAMEMTPANAAAELEDYRNLSKPERRRLLTVAYPSGRIDHLLKLLSTDALSKYQNEVAEILRWIQETETRTASGLTDEQMADIQAKHKQAKDEERARKELESKTPKGEKPPEPTSKDIQEAGKKNVSETSIKPTTTTTWDKMSQSEKEKWQERSEAVIQSVLSFAHQHYPELKLTEANFKADFEAVEKRGQSVLAHGESSGKTLQAAFGFRFVEAAEVNPAYVMSVVVHEIFGHPEYGPYGSEYHLALYDRAAAKIPAYKQPPSGSPERRSEIDAYAYQETEIYSLLRSLPYHTPIAPKDVSKNLVSIDPKQTVQHRIGRMKQQWAPELIVPLVRGFYQRLKHDPRITPEALTAFEAGVKANFPAEFEEILK